MSTERIEVEVREDGSRVVQRNLEDLARSAEVTAASMDLMKSALATIQGSVQGPISSLQQIRAALAALQAAARSPGGLMDVSNINFAAAALDRLRQSTVAFAKEAPSNVQAAIGRINLATGALADQFTKAMVAQQALASAKAAPPPAAMTQSAFGFMSQPMALQGAGWQLEGQFKSVATAAQQTAGSIASIAAPTQAFANVAKAAGSSAQQLNLNLGAANQTSFGFMHNMAAQTAPVNQLARQYSTVGTVWSTTTKQAQQLAFGFNQVGAAANNAATVAKAAVPSMNSLTDSFFNMRNVLRGMAAYLFLGEIKKYIDTWIGANNMIALYTSSAGEAAEVQKRLFGVAQETRQEYGTLTSLYQRTAQAAGNLGASQEQMIQFTRGVGMALAVQNRTSTQAAGSLLQLGQLLGMAKIRMQEFNSISENMPIVLQIVAKHVDGAGGSIARLRDLIHSGKLTSAGFFEAFLKGQDELEASFKKLNPTISQAFNVLDNAVGKFISGTDKASGASNIFARSVIKIAENIDVLAKAALALAAGALAVALPSLITSLVGVAATADVAATGLRGLWAAAAANPLTLVAATIIAAMAAIYMFRDSIVVVEEKGITLGDVFRVQFQYIIDIAKATWSFMVDVWKAWPKIEVFNVDGTEKQIGLIEGIVTSFMSSQKDKVNLLISEWATFSRVTPILWNGMWDVIKEATVDFINDQISKIDTLLNLFITFLNLIDQAKNPFSHVDIPKLELPKFTNENKGAAEKLGEDIAKAIAGSFKDYVGAAIKKFQEDVSFAASSRQFLAAGGLNRPADLSIKTPKVPGSDTEIEKMQKKLDAMHSTIDPVWAAVHHLAVDEKLLNDALAMGIKLWDTKENIMKKAREHYEDILHPYEAIIRKLEEEISLNKQWGIDRKGGVQALRDEEALKKRGITLTDEQLERLRELHDQADQARQDASEKFSLYQRLIRVEQNYTNSQEVLGKALKNNKITLSQYRVEMAQLAVNAGKGTFIDGFITQLGFLDKKMTNWAARSGAIIADLMNGVIDGVSNAIGRALASGENFIGLIRSMGREILSSLVSAFIKLGIQILIVKLFEDSWVASSILGTAAKTSATLAATATTTAAGVAAAGTATATAAVTGPAITAEMAPAAATTSIATLGIGAAVGIAAFLAAMAIAKGFESGGYTGLGGRNEVAGVVHGREFVVNADATSKYRGVLEAMNSGRHLLGYEAGGYVHPVIPSMSISSPTSSSSVQLNMTVVHDGSTTVEVERVSETEYRIMARQEAQRAVREDSPRVIDSHMNDPNSKLSRTVSRTTTATRRRS